MGSGGRGIRRKRKQREKRSRGIDIEKGRGREEREGGKYGRKRERGGGGKEEGKEGGRKRGKEEGKETSYDDLVHRARQAGYNTHLITVEVGARGVPHMAAISKLNQARARTHPNCTFFREGGRDGEKYPNPDQSPLSKVNLQSGYSTIWTATSTIT